MSARWKDLLERTLWTAVQAFAGVLVATDVTGSVQWKDVFIAAGVAAGLAVAKALVAFQFGNPDSAALPETKPS